MTKKIWIGEDKYSSSRQFVELFWEEPYEYGIKGWNSTAGNLLFCRKELEKFFEIEVPKDIGRNLLEIEVDIKSKVVCTWEPE